MSAQGGFDFSVPAHDVARVSPTGTVKPFIAPATGISRHCSAMGAQAAETFAEGQRLRLLSAYETHGPLTDAEMEQATGIDRSSVCARRNELINARLVERDGGTRKNVASGISNTLWRAVQGLQVARDHRAETT